MSTPSGGSAQNEPSTSAPQGSSPEGKGFSQEEPKKSSTPQRGAQEQRGPQNQRGAQDNEPGAGGAPGAKERRARTSIGQQDQDRGKAGPGQAQQSGTSGRAGGASVQLSQDQRTKIKDVIVRDRNVGACR